MTLEEKEIADSLLKMGCTHAHVTKTGPGKYLVQITTVAALDSLKVSGKVEL